MNEVQIKLMEYGNLESTEIGEVVFQLAVVWEQRISLSDIFVKVLEKEMRDYLAYFIENTRIIDKEETAIKKWQELEWIDP